MMFNPQGAVRKTCRLLAVTSEDLHEHKWKKNVGEEHLRYPFPELYSLGRLEVRSLASPSKGEFSNVVESYQPNLIYLKGVQLKNDEIGSLSWRGVDFSTVEVISDLFITPLPTTVYLEIPNGDVLAEALHAKGIPYVIYWKNTFSRYAASHFCNAFLSVIRSSSAHPWDVFQLAHAFFRLYCSHNNNLHYVNEHEVSDEFCPRLLGEDLKINIEPPESDMADAKEDSLGTLPAINIYANDVNMKFLICGELGKLDAYLLGALEDGLNALLNIEIRGSTLHSKFSAPPPPVQAEIYSPGVVTMRCDISTCTYAHISLLLSGSAQTCFDDQLLENHIKKEIIGNRKLVHVLTNYEESKVPLFETRKSASVACGAAIFEVGMKVPNWASQILRQLAPDISYRSLVALGIAGIQGVPVASFERDDADRLLFFRSKLGEDKLPNNLILSPSPSWLKPPAPTRKRSKPGINAGFLSSPTCLNMSSTRFDKENKEMTLVHGFSTSLLPARPRSKVLAMRPIPRTHHHKRTLFSGMSEANGRDRGHIKPNIVVVIPPKHVVVRSTSGSQQKAFSSSSQSQKIITLNPLPLKKHGCSRNPLQDCCEEEFLKDVLHFMVERGHTRLVPQGGLGEFPDAVLNGKRLDLYNLYKEVVSRGGFCVGNGINWKGQIFSKMGNYTMTNKMTGVGNTLKRHYETYLLEYELAHDDVDGECCLLCHSNAAGDWMNCGICGEWAHFGCDRRQGLGAFKDYAKTDGLEYICPNCSITNFKKKPQTLRNGFCQGLLALQPLGD